MKCFVVRVQHMGTFVIQAEDTESALSIVQKGFVTSLYDLSFCVDQVTQTNFTYTQVINVDRPALRSLKLADTNKDSMLMEQGYVCVQETSEGKFLYERAPVPMSVYLHDHLAA
jgi:hypothetical protein